MPEGFLSYHFGLSCYIMTNLPEITDIFFKPACFPLKGVEAPDAIGLHRENGSCSVDIIGSCLHQMTESIRAL